MLSVTSMLCTELTLLFVTSSYLHSTRAAQGKVLLTGPAKVGQILLCYLWARRARQSPSACLGSVPEKKSSAVVGTSPGAPPWSPSSTKEEVAKTLRGKCHCSHSSSNTSFWPGIGQTFPLPLLNAGRRVNEWNLKNKTCQRLQNIPSRLWQWTKL